MAMHAVIMEHECTASAVAWLGVLLVSWRNPEVRRPCVCVFMTCVCVCVFLCMCTAVFLGVRWHARCALHCLISGAQGLGLRRTKGHWWGACAHPCWRARLCRDDPGSQCFRLHMATGTIHTHAQTYTDIHTHRHSFMSAAMVPACKGSGLDMRY